MKLLTPPGIAGIAVLRADPAERAALFAVLRDPDGRPLQPPGASRPRRACLLLEGDLVDDVLVVDRGDLGIEVHTHGAPLVLDAMRRAFDVAAAEPSSPAERLLWHAMSIAQVELAVEQFAFDFAAFCADVAVMPTSLRARTAAEFARRTIVARALAETHRVVLVGAQNAGKSSLLNALLFRERALTGPEPGLTRDPVADATSLDGYPYKLVDTAGEGPTSTRADERALARARAERTGAATILVVDRSIGPSPVDRALAASAVLVVANKADLPAAPWPADVPCHVCVSCASDEPAAIRREVGRRLRERRGLTTAGRVGGVAALSLADEQLFAASVAGSMG